MPEKKLETRQATVNDKDYVWQVYKEAVRSHIEPHLKGGWKDADELAKFQKTWKPGDSHIILIDGEPVGWGGATVSQSSVILEHLYIEPTHRDKGYGQKLVSELLAHWQKEGKVVHAPILRGSPVVKFAKDLGFTKHSDGHSTLTEMYTFGTEN